MTRLWRSPAGHSMRMMACCALGAGPCAPWHHRLHSWRMRRGRALAGTPAAHEDGHVSGCLCCGARGAAMVRQFETGGDAAASVFTTALYQALPPAEGEDADQPGEGRKLLLFSDGRQAAAFFAPYLETSYGTIQHRRLIDPCPVPRPTRDRSGG